jgi:hypothetical protein
MRGNVDKRCKTTAREEGWGLRPRAPNKRGRQLRRPYPHGNMPKMSAVTFQFSCNLLIYTGSVGSDFTSKRLKELCKRLTLDQRVPGSSPGAPTKLFRHLASPSGSHPTSGQRLFRQIGCFCSLLATLLGPRDQLLTRALRVGRQLSRRPMMTRSAQLSVGEIAVGAFGKAAMTERGK